MNDVSPGRKLGGFGRWLVRNARWIATTALLILLLLLVIAALNSRGRLAGVEARLRAGQVQTGYVPRTDSEKQAMEEFEGADHDSGYVTRAVAACHGTEDGNLVSGTARYYLNLQGDVPPAYADKARPLLLTGLDHAALQLDAELTTDRWRTYRNTLVSQSASRRLQGIIIIAGALATLFVTVKATESAKNSVLIGLLAIFFSTSSTALTGWNAFTAPAAAATASQQRLATLRGIHQKLVQTVQQYYTSPLCPGPATPALPIPGETAGPPPAAVTPSVALQRSRGRTATSAAKTPSSFNRAYARAFDEVAKLEDEYFTTLQLNPGTETGGSGGKPAKSG